MEIRTATIQDVDKVIELSSQLNIFYNGVRIEPKELK
jgi:hypothetical protein